MNFISFASMLDVDETLTKERKRINLNVIFQCEIGLNVSQMNDRTLFFQQSHRHVTTIFGCRAQ